VSVFPPSFALAFLLVSRGDAVGLGLFFSLCENFFQTFFFFGSVFPIRTIPGCDDLDRGGFFITVSNGLYSLSRW